MDPNPNIFGRTVFMDGTKSFPKNSAAACHIKTGGQGVCPFKGYDNSTPPIALVQKWLTFWYPKASMVIPS